MKLAEFTPSPELGEEPWKLEVEHFSASSLGMLQRCPEQYRQRYVLHRKMRPGVALVLGGACHNANEHNFGQKIASGIDVPAAEMVEFWNDKAWPDMVEKNGGVKEILWKGSPEETRSTGQGMVSLYHAEVSPRVQPDAVEAKFLMPIPGIPVPLIGYVDLIQKDGAPAIDLKTSGKRVKSVQGKWETQNRIYKMFTGRAVDWHILASTKTPSVTTPLEEPALHSPYSEPETRRTLAFVQQLAWLANTFMTKFGPDEPWPTTGTFNEQCGWCGYRPVCPAWVTP